MTVDVAIIGLGPAGIAAAIYAKRSGLSVLAFESSVPGGLVNYTFEVDNYPGLKKISGPDFAMDLYEHFKSFDIEMKSEEVIDFEDGDIKKIITNKGEYKAKKIIIATGRKRRMLGLDREGELLGKGISYCALCDGNFYKNEDVIVVGSGDSAFEEALYLSNITKSVKILVRKEASKANADLSERVKLRENISILYNTEVKELITEDDRLSGVKTSNEEVIEAKGLFIYVGFDPIVPFKTEHDFEKKNGYLVVDKNYETNIKGVYAVGDIIYKDLYQIIAAEYEGAVAASSIARELTR